MGYANKQPCGRAMRTLGVFLGIAITTWASAGVVWAPAAAPEVLFEPDYIIRHAPEGGVLREAGFLAGDSVLSVEGIPVSRLGMYSRWPRSLARGPGESIRMVADRDGTRVSGAVRYRAAPSGTKARLVATDLVGLTFVWLGIFSLLRVRSSASVHFALMALALGVFLPGPNLGAANGVRDNIQTAFLVLWALLLSRFLLVFPRRKACCTGPRSTILMVVPWIAVLVCSVLELAFHPRFYHTFGPMIGMSVAGFLFLAVAALGHTLFTTPGTELRRSGVAAVLGGLGLGLAGVLAWIALNSIIPQTPGWVRWLPLSMIAVPLGFAVGVRQHATGKPATS